MLLILSLTVSCGYQSQSKLLEKELHAKKEKNINLHDELMEKMSVLNSTKKLLQALREDSTFEGNQDDFIIAINALVESDKSMWDWMHNFDIAYKNENDSISLIYFEDKYKILQKIDTAFDASISEGEKLIFSL